MRHYSVMMQESINALEIKENGIYIDCTLGRGGHSSEILKKLTTGHLYCFDQDEEAIAESEPRLKAIGDNFTIIKANFAEIKTELNNRGIEQVDGILYDLGVSSPQFDDAHRGFSYRYDAELDMRMDISAPLDAKKIVNEYTDKELMVMFYKYGEHQLSGRVARKIVEVRNMKPINTTFELNEVIKSAMPQKFLRKKGHPSKQFYQALRIETNKEMEVLETSLESARELIKIGGNIVAISFHSLEDRIVKHTFREWVTTKIPKHLPLPEDDVEFKLVNRKPIAATEEELEENNRSHSAKLRIIRRIKHV